MGPQTKLSQVIRAASACWIVSVFVYSDGALPGNAGDWLQLAAASSWMAANISSLFRVKENS